MILMSVRSLLHVAKGSHDVTTSPSNTLQFVFPIQKTATDPQSLLNHNRAIGSKYFENHFLSVQLQMNQQLN